MTTLRSLVRHLLRGTGYDVHRFHPSLSAEAQLALLLRALKVDLVLDVGANTGQFGALLRKLGYAGRIVSFEPLEEARRQLVAAAAGDARWTVAERAAIGERDGEIEIHVAANSVSSSALEMLDAHVKSAPGSQYVGTQRVAVRRLDTLAAKALDGASVPLLKIDTQGFEDRVLDGAAGLLPRVAAIQLEVSLVPLYAGQRLFPEMAARLRDLGFDLWAMWPAFVEPESGRLLQADATFVRR
jgi:FkbM family methyltransferase